MKQSAHKELLTPQNLTHLLEDAFVGAFLTKTLEALEEMRSQYSIDYYETKQAHGYGGQETSIALGKQMALAEIVDKIKTL